MHSAETQRVWQSSKCTLFNRPNMLPRGEPTLLTDFLLCWKHWMASFLSRTESQVHSWWSSLFLRLENPTESTSRLQTKWWNSRSERIWWQLTLQVMQKANKRALRLYLKICPRSGQARLIRESRLHQVRPVRGDSFSALFSRTNLQI